jgi:hypothetical protein
MVMLFLVLAEIAIIMPAIKSAFMQASSPHLYPKKEKLVSLDYRQSVILVRVGIYYYVDPRWQRQRIATSNPLAPVTAAARPKAWEVLSLPDCSSLRQSSAASSFSVIPIASFESCSRC